MSESDETFDQRYQQFVNTLQEVCSRILLDRSLIRVLSATQFAPEEVASYLKLVAELMEKEANIDIAIRRNSSPVNSEYLESACAEIKAGGASYRKLIPLWDAVLAACDSPEEIPGRVEGFRARTAQGLMHGDDDF